MVQTFYDIVKARGGGPIAIGMMVETMSTKAAALAGKEWAEFIMIFPLS